MATARRRRNLSWAELMRRVFAIERARVPPLWASDADPGRDPPARLPQAILECLEPPSRAAPIEPARPDEPEETALPGGLGEDEFGA
jgi:hypothetical protein